MTVPRYADPYSLALTDFPRSFQAELERYLARLSCDDPVDLLDETAPPRPLRPSSIKTRRYQILAFASALVHQDVPIKTITGLAVLAEPANFRLALRFFLDRPRQDPTSTRSAGQFAHSIRTIARYWLKWDEKALAPLNAITARLNRHEPGMTDTNRARLAQFDDPAILGRLLALPAREMVRLRRKADLTRNGAVDFGIVLALEILLHAPLRIANLAALVVGATLLLPPGGKPGPSTILIPRGRVKNGQQVHLTLPEDVTESLRYYIAKVRPQLTETLTEALFPNQGGKPKRADTLSKQLTALIRDRLGVDFNPHLARHLAAKLIVDHQPGAYEAARRLLGHVSGETTFSTYQGLETNSATRLYADIVRDRRDYVPHAERPRLGRRLRRLAGREEGITDEAKKPPRRRRRRRI